MIVASVPPRIRILGFCNRRGHTLLGIRTAYGDWTYWGFGAMLCLIGTFSIVLAIPPSEFDSVRRCRR